VVAQDRCVSRGLALGLVLGMAGFLPCAGAAEAAPDARELLDRYQQAVTRWERSVSMRIECDQSTNYQSGRDLRHWKYDLTHRRDGDRCEWFGRCQFEGKLDGDTYSFNEELRDLVLEDYYLHHSQRDTGPDRLDAFIATDVKEKLRGLLARSCSAGFLEGHMEGIGNATHQVYVMCDSNELRYVGSETLNGTRCHVVEAKTPYGTFTVWLAPEKGYHALKSVWRKSAGDILRGNIRISDQDIGAWTVTVEATDVQKIDGVFLPVAGRFTWSSKLASGALNEEHVTIQRRDIVLHPSFQALGAFQIVLPDGTEVRLLDDSAHTGRWSNGKFTPDIIKYVVRNLLGKPLPALEAIRMDWNPSAATGKRLLICFLDIQQRPSRNIALQMIKQADWLQQKGVVVMVIQATKMDRPALQTWARDNKIPFPTGMIKGDEDQVRAAWGVKASPWLILADQEHIVQAEGFGLDELQKRMEAVTNE
jgi:hypothetical protein